jgi:NAD(P)-dependent dehydrogenase (short-subunit alcohol dehydrogenase family)
MKDLAGKVAVVTGGGAGIGRALGVRFAQEGMKVVLADVIEDTLNTTVDELSAQFPDITGVDTDVSSYESVEALRDGARRVAGRPDTARLPAGRFDDDAAAVGAEELRPTGERPCLP